MISNLASQKNPECLFEGKYLQFELMKRKIKNVIWNHKYIPWQSTCHLPCKDTGMGQYRASTGSMQTASFKYRPSTGTYWPVYGVDTNLELYTSSITVIKMHSWWIFTKYETHMLRRCRLSCPY